METLINKLKSEVGLTAEQATQVVKVFHQYMKDNDLSIDWESFLKTKATKISDSTRSAFDQFFGDDGWVADKVEQAEDGLDSLSAKAKEKFNEVRNKAADFLATDDKK